MEVRERTAHPEKCVVLEQPLRVRVCACVSARARVCVRVRV